MTGRRRLAVGTAVAALILLTAAVTGWVTWRRASATAAAEWRLADRDEGCFLRGARLDQFAGWAAGTNLALTLEEQTSGPTGTFT